MLFVPTTARALKAGAVDFLQKPCRGEEVLEAVERGLRRDRQEMASERTRA